MVCFNIRHTVVHYYSGSVYSKANFFLFHGWNFMYHIFLETFNGNMFYDSKLHSPLNYKTVLKKLQQLLTSFLPATLNFKHNLALLRIPQKVFYVFLLNNSVSILIGCKLSTFIVRSLRVIVLAASPFIAILFCSAVIFVLCILYLSTCVVCLGTYLHVLYIL